MSELKLPSSTCETAGWLLSDENDTKDASDDLWVPVTKGNETKTSLSLANNVSTAGTKACSLYEKETVYENFIEWKTSSNALSFTEDVFLAYFNDLANKHESSTLWQFYSMLKSTVWTAHGIDLKLYSNLTEFLKRLSKGPKRQTPKTLSEKNVDQFLKSAPDVQYLGTKAAIIFVIAGGCTREELRHITSKDVDTHDKMLLVRITNPKSSRRSFPIQSPFYEIVKKYEALRTPKAKSNFFFQNYRRGKCGTQPIGLNKFSGMPKEIAKFLGLPDANSYTGVWTHF